MEVPPKAGPGATEEAWVDYASSVGVVVEDGWSRNDIIEAVEAAEVGDEPEVEPEPESPDEPEPAGDGGAVRFESRATRKRVYAPDGTVLGRFVEDDESGLGVLETANPELIALLDEQPDVRRAD